METACNHPVGSPAWCALPLVGHQMTAGVTLEIRRCPVCTETQSLEVTTGTAATGEVDVLETSFEGWFALADDSGVFAYVRDEDTALAIQGFFRQRRH